jgi:RNA polymerase sigma-70 factor (ECF subfamily)
MSNSSRPKIDPQRWVDEHGDALYRFAYVYLRDKMAAEDAVQDTLLAAFKAVEQFDGRASERTWLTSILRNKLIDQIRTRKREVPTDLREGSDEAIEDDLFDQTGHWIRPPSNWGSPDKAFEQQAFWRALQECIDTLPARHAQAFTLCEIDGVDGAEASKVLNTSTSNIWVSLHRARLRLQQCLELRWYGNATPEQREGR